jgi:hypothetical protein
MIKTSLVEGRILGMAAGLALPLATPSLAQDADKIDCGSY